MKVGSQPLPRVTIVSPALAPANNGNWHTASRWRRFLVPVARATIASAWSEDDDAELLIALHARRSAESIARWHQLRPDAPLVLVLTGTDLYRDLDDDPRARHSLECASRIVVLQEAGLARLAVPARAKAMVVVQSAPALRAKRTSADADFVAVGHLREEKDPETLMRATRRLAAADARETPTIVHIGAALDVAFADAARSTMRDCPAYRWAGPLAHSAARRAIAKARALVHMSRMEGGANVVVEALRSGVPVLASAIDGNVGLLGADYDGYFAVGDDAALAALMRRFLADEAFALHLAAQCDGREPLFRPAAERNAVRSLALDLVATSPRRR